MTTLQTCRASRMEEAVCERGKHGQERNSVEAYPPLKSHTPGA